MLLSASVAPSLVLPRPEVVSVMRVGVTCVIGPTMPGGGEAVGDGLVVVVVAMLWIESCGLASMLSPGMGVGGMEPPGDVLAPGDMSARVFPFGKGEGEPLLGLTGLLLDQGGPDALGLGGDKVVEAVIGVHHPVVISHCVLLGQGPA